MTPGPPGRSLPGRPVLGRPSAAADREPVLSAEGDATTASWRAEGSSTGRWTVRAASVTGVRHRLAGRGNEDAFAWAHQDGLLAVAVTDGVGSRTGAARAAVSAAVSVAVPGVADTGDSRLDSAVAAALWAASDAVGPAAVDPGPADLGGATTLTVAVLADDGTAGLGRIGDSTALVLDRCDGWSELFASPDPERSDTVTAALPCPDPAAVAERTTTAIGPGRALVLLSDGIADPWRDGPSTVAPALTAAILDGPDPLELLRLADFSRQGCSDDRTVVAIWPAPPREGPADTDGEAAAADEG